MKEEIFDTMGSLLCKIDENKRVKLFPVIAQTISNIVVSIRNSPDLESADDFFELLGVFTRRKWGQPPLIKRKINITLDLWQN